MPPGFNYRSSRHQRRHGPLNYANYASYRPWLRDEFTFCCVYCLNREQWGRVQGMFDLDHFTPQRVAPEEREDYDNLIYACHSCNLTKGDQNCPDPLSVLTSDQVLVHDDQAIEPLTEAADRLIRILDLDDEEYRAWRRLMIRIIELAEKRDSALYRQLMEFPHDLPNLARLRPPGGNTRPDGVQKSYFQVRRGGELPEIY